MTTDTWLTIIGLFIAFLAFFPKDELSILRNKLTRLEIVSLIAIVFLILPYLLFFRELSNRIGFLQVFTVSWGIDPRTLAFLLAYLTLVWSGIRLTILKPKKNFTKKLEQEYITLLNNRPFEHFFKLFNKYEDKNNILSNWHIYKPVVFHVIFVKGIIQLKNDFILEIWRNTTNNEEFQLVFESLLNNKESIYYSEIRKNKDSYSLLPENLFLNFLFKENIAKSVGQGLLKQISSYGKYHLQIEGYSEKASIYNQRYMNYFHDKEGYYLEMLFHVNFIGLLYYTLIEENIDIQNEKSRYTNIQSIYSDWVKEMVTNISVSNDDDTKEYPTNYHWLISQMIGNCERWLEEFNTEKHFDKMSSYNNFIPLALGNIFVELFRGIVQGKISERFTYSKAQMVISSFYFNAYAQENLLTKFEEHFLLKIPPKRLPVILKAVLDFSLAFDYDSLLTKKYDFPVMSDWEKKRLERLHGFLSKNDLLNKRIDI